MTQIDTNIQDLVVVGDFLYMAGIDRDGVIPSLEIWFVRYPDQLVRLSTLNFDSYAKEINYLYIQGHYLYGVPSGVGSGGSTFLVIDIADPANPVEVAALPVPFPTYRIFVQGRYAYMSGGVVGGGATGRFAVYDVGDPTAPTLVTTVNVGTTINGIFAIGRYLYLCDDDSTAGTLRIYNISDPLAPTPISSIAMPNTPSRCTDVWVDGKYAYVVADCAGGGQMVVFDIADPEVVAIVGLTVGTTCFENIRGQGDHVYVTGFEPTLRQIDVSDRSAPFTLNNLDLGYAAASRADIQGRFVWVAPFSRFAHALQVYYVGGFYCEEIQTAGLQVDGGAAMDTVESRRLNLSGELVTKEITVAQGGGATVDGVSILDRIISLEERLKQLEDKVNE